MIPCSKLCRYQQDGVCTLESAAPTGMVSGDCIHYVPQEDEQIGAEQKNPTREIYYPEPKVPPYEG